MCLQEWENSTDKMLDTLKLSKPKNHLNKPSFWLLHTAAFCLLLTTAIKETVAPFMLSIWPAIPSSKISRKNMRNMFRREKNISKLFYHINHIL